MPATGDTALRLAIPFGNDGTGLFLPTTAASIVDIERSLVKVDNSAIDAARHGAPITRVSGFTVAGIAVGWAGGQLALQRMNAHAQLGRSTGVVGHAPSWTCADDFNTTVPATSSKTACPRTVVHVAVPVDDLPRSPIDPPTGIVAGSGRHEFRALRRDRGRAAFISNPAGTRRILQVPRARSRAATGSTSAPRERGATRTLAVSPTLPATGKLAPACGLLDPGDRYRRRAARPTVSTSARTQSAHRERRMRVAATVVDTDTDGYRTAIDP